MEDKTYRRMTDRELAGRKVRLRFELKTQVLTIPAGAVLRIVHKWKGLELEGEPCPTCGLLLAPEPETFKQA